MFVDALRAAVVANKDVVLDSEDIRSAQYVIIKNEPEETKFEVNAESGVKGSQEEQQYDVATVFFCWINRDATVTDYIGLCESKKIKVITFLEKTELISYIKGEIDECPYVVKSNTDEDILMAESGAAASNVGPVVPLTETNFTITATEPTSDASKANASASNDLTKEHHDKKTQTSSQKNKRATEDVEKIDYKEIKRKKIEEDPLLKSIAEHEVELIDHDRALRGTLKSNDFSNLIRECEYKIIRPLKASASGKKPSSSSGTNSTSSSSALKASRKPTSSTSKGSKGVSASTETSLATILHKKDPIIILSPSAIAMLTMQNVKSFLQDGKFIDPQEAILQNTENANIIHIVRQSKRFNKKIKFVVVSNVEKFFVKPQYWDRVVAVFTTGQEWQFKNYQVNQPNLLFQKVKGFYVNYSGDIVPQNVQNWNVQVISLERNQRFKDRQISEYLWESIERFMLSKGYK